MYLGKHEPGNCVFSVRHRHVFTHILPENLGGSEQNRSVIANVHSDDLWPSRMHAATHILSSFNFFVRGSERRIFSRTECVSAVQSYY